MDLHLSGNCFHWLPSMTGLAGEGGVMLQGRWADPLSKPVTKIPSSEKKGNVTALKAMSLNNLIRNQISSNFFCTKIASYLYKRNYETSELYV